VFERRQRAGVVRTTDYSTGTENQTDTHVQGMPVPESLETVAAPGR
jgi:hypothetical protein